MVLAWCSSVIPKSSLSHRSRRKASVGQTIANFARHQLVHMDTRTAQDKLTLIPNDGSSNGERVRRDRLLTYLVWMKYVTFQAFWTNDTLTDEVTVMHEIAAPPKNLTSMMSRRYLEKESI
jgi:hypothetical protein